MCKLFEKTQTVTLIIVCEKCGKQMLKERYAANRTEIVTITSVCEACVKKEANKEVNDETR